MKVLYINELDFNKVQNGGSNGELSHLKILEELYDVETVDIFANLNRTKMHILFDLATSPVPIFYSRQQVNRIVHIIKTTDAKIIFIENSNLGYFAKVAKKLNKKVVVFFHNCEIVFAKACRNKLWRKTVYRNESLALRYADYSFVLSERDENEIKKNYQQIFSKIIRLPVSMSDRLTDEDRRFLEQTKRKNHFIFVGSFFKPNVEAAIFINNELADKCPDVVFDIYGFQMEELNIPFKTNVINHGTANDIHRCFIDADVMIFPIFSGSGMKVKTEESLMYGKFIIGSPESFSGYSIEGCDCLICQNVEEYVYAIHKLCNCGIRFSKLNRSLWERDFNISRTKAILSQSIKGLL